jgi:hypothetical protein
LDDIRSIDQPDSARPLRHKRPVSQAAVFHELVHKRLAASDHCSSFTGSYFAPPRWREVNFVPLSLFPPAYLSLYPERDPDLPGPMR